MSAVPIVFVKDRFLRFLRKIKNMVVIALMFLGYHGCDGLMFWISNSYGFIDAILLIACLLSVLSIVLVYIHGFCFDRYGWDILGMRRLNTLRSGGQPDGIWESFFQRVLFNGYWWIYFLGSWTAGPFIVSILLRRCDTIKENLRFIVPGAIISAVIWVIIWKIIGNFTWEQYVKPFWSVFTGLGG